MPHRYLFVDGACFEQAMKSFGDKYFGHPIPIAPERLKASPLGLFDKVFYYDALPIQERGETEEDWRARTAEKRVLLERLESTDYFEVFEGDVRRKGGGRDRSRGQKKVDIAIAVDMLTHTFRRNMSNATLLAGDLDFAPLLRALSLEGMPVDLIHPENTTAELKRAALTRTALTPHHLWNCTSSEFLARNPECSASLGSDHNPGGIQGESWVDAEGFHHTIFIIGDRFLFRKRKSGHNTLNVEHGNRRQLVLYCEDVWNIKFPDTFPRE